MGVHIGRKCEETRVMGHQTDSTICLGAAHLTGSAIIIDAIGEGDEQCFDEIQKEMDSRKKESLIGISSKPLGLRCL